MFNDLVEVWNLFFILVCNIMFINLSVLPEKNRSISKGFSDVGSYICKNSLQHKMSFCIFSCHELSDSDSIRYLEIQFMLY